ncbi:MAG TPA: glutathione S-transferase [Geminicoccus sp.]|uniref:glutathione S-transferase family protein n=1 Tax=Geminicoccus sp. TaxID=2024832 RepID=UPI002BBF3579|nr:glutathione S-transferase [Geminicoccus sp.]HWL70574.1 glutathione S-transferase [Geminicoccus sp.]
MAAAAAATTGGPLPCFVLGSRQAGSPALPVWLVLRQLGIPFEEAPFRPVPVAGRLPFAVEPPQDQVPLLHAGRLLVWGALPILEHLAERHAGVWPADRAARAAVREVAAEAANSFPRLQALAAGEAAGRLPQPREIGGLTEELRRLQRLVDRHRHQAAGGGPFLFGTFSGADALLAPLLGRVLRQALAADPVATGYFRALAALPACQAWLAEADQPAEAAAPVAAPTHLIAPEAAEQAQEQAEPQPAPPVEEPPAPTPPVEEPPPAGEPPVPPPPPRLEDVDRPPITYLEDPPVLGWRRLPFLERIAPLPLAPPSLPPLPTRTSPSGTAVPPVRPPAAAAPEPVPPARPTRQPRAPVRPPVAPPPAEPARPERTAPERTRPADEGEDPFLFRLRRPGTVGEPGSRPLNRFARALGTGRQRDPQPPDDEPEPPGGRPAAIKPIGFSTQRRR